ncbi:DUF6233 domain-containing protein [Streptomyces sp. NBC_00444]|uniref:DUF6233 domain-containing protein n=1 Tax=Streptomyces sp. NBC_00444 TaxID=2975744 RepID=UPI002E1F0FB3
MNELPPDPVRLHAILQWLDQQITDHDTVGTYLRLQRDAVRAALAKAEQQTPARGRPAQSPIAVPPPAQNLRRRTKPFQLERQRTPDGPLPTAVHTADCHMAGQLAHSVNAMEARLALTDARLEACQFCRPELDVDVG